MTYYLLLGLGILLVAVGFATRRRFALPGQAMIVIGCLGGAACLVWQLRQTVFTPEGQGPDRGQAVVSYFLAGQVLREAGNRQGPVVLFFPPPSVLDEEAVGTYAGTFKRVLRGFPELQVQEITLDVPSKAAKTGRIPLSAFQRSVSNAPPAVAYVSFAGVPADIELFVTNGPSGLFVFDPWGTTNWFSALKKGRIRTVIVPRPGVRAGSDAEMAGEPQAVLDRLYLMATPANAEKILAEMQAP